MYLNKFHRIITLATSLTSPNHRVQMDRKFFLWIGIGILDNNHFPQFSDIGTYRLIVVHRCIVVRSDLDLEMWEVPSIRIGTEPRSFSVTVVSRTHTR